jgi:apolipoprotein N-acyltransferase
LIRRAPYALAAGLAVALSLPPWGWWPLSFLGVALFQWCLSGPGVELSRGARFGLGMVFALAWIATGTAWMWEFSTAGFVAANVVYASWHGLAELAVPAGDGADAERAARWSIVIRPLAHTLVEAVRFSFPFGGVPLASLGIAQADGPFAGLARVGGVILLTWFVLQLGVALGALATAPSLRAGGTGRVAAASVVVAVVLLGVALVAPRGHATGDTVDIAAVQGGGEQGTSALDVPPSVVTQRHLDATAAIDADPALDLVVWPENIVDVPRFEGSAELAAIAEQSRRLGVPIAVGITEDVPGQPARFTNAEVVVTPSGVVASRYDKVRRVPFGEYMPLRGLLDALGAPVGEVPHDAIAGTGPAVLDVPVDIGTDAARVERLAVVISWEVFFGGRVREGVRDEGGIVINPTNGASYTGTIVQSQQIASSRLRAIETGRWLVQVSPTGFSAFVTPGGEVIDRTSVGERSVIRHTVEVRAGRTWYVALGDRPLIGLLLAALVIAELWYRWPRRAAGAATRSALDEHRDGAVVHE